LRGFAAGRGMNLHVDVTSVPGADGGFILAGLHQTGLFLQGVSSDSRLG